VHRGVGHRLPGRTSRVQHHVEAGRGEFLRQPQAARRSAAGGEGGRGVHLLDHDAAVRNIVPDVPQVLVRVWDAWDCFGELGNFAARGE
jgi:hypothetical protein